MLIKKYLKNGRKTTPLSWKSVVSIKRYVVLLKEHHVSGRPDPCKSGDASSVDPQTLDSRLPDPAV